jgi:ABC-type branched-subunit amino acid transport system substrate-binding protein
MRSVLLCAAVVLCACPKNVSGQDGPATGAAPHVEAKSVPEADAALEKASALKPRKAAIEAWLQVRASWPDSTAGEEALYRAGVAAYEEGDYAQARKSLNELIFENPLFAKVNDARLKSGLSSLELKTWRDAYQTLSPLCEKLEGAERQQCDEALAKAAAGSQQFGEALKLALRQVDEASADERPAALKKLEDVVETKSTFLAVAEAWHELPTAHPAWPLLTFKMARVYYHLRDWHSLDESLRALLQNAPNSPFAPDAKALLARISKRTDVKVRALGAVLPLTGKYKDLGDAVMRGLQLGLKGSDIELVVKDSQGDTNLAGKLVEQLALDDGVIAIVGPLLTDDARRAALVAEELQVPLITLSRAEGLTDIGPHVFRTMVTNSQQAAALADYAINTLGYKSFGVLAPNIPFGQEMSNDFWDEVEKRGGQIRGAEMYEHDQTTFTNEVKKLVGRYYLEDRSDYYEKVREIRESGSDDFHKRKALDKAKSNLEPVIDFEALLIPDTWRRVALVAPALAVEDVVTNACDKHDLERIQKTTGKDKLKTVTLLGPSTWTSPKNETTGDPLLLERGNKYVLCSVWVDGFYEDSERPQTRAFVQAFREVNHKLPITLLDAVGYDTAGLVRQVLEKQAPRSREGFREALAQVKNYEGATGTTSFDDRREAKRPLFLLNITPRGVKEVTPQKKPEG